MRASIQIDENYCKGCALCIDVCPRQLITLSRQLNSLGVFPAAISAEHLSACTGCTLCAQICPDVAITVFRESD